MLFLLHPSPPLLPPSPDSHTDTLGSDEQEISSARSRSQAECQGELSPATESPQQVLMLPKEDVGAQLDAGDVSASSGIEITGGATSTCFLL